MQVLCLTEATIYCTFCLVW